MIELQDIVKAAEAGLAEMANGGLFVVDVKMSGGDEFEVYIDSDGVGADGRLRGVSVEDCVTLTKAIESKFDREAEDFSLTVSSAGIGQPLKALRQYRKLIGRPVEVVLATGTKLVATLEAVEEGGSITLSYPEKHRMEGKKKPETVTVTKTFAPDEIKTTKEYIDFK